MAAAPLAKPPDPLNLNDTTHRGDNWKQFKRDWTYYETASKINKEEGPVRVAHLLNVIGKEGQEMFETFSLSDTDCADIAKVLEEFEARCTSVTHVIYERYIFNKRVQEPGESLDHYLTDIIKQASRCQYGRLQDELVRDRLVSGIQNDRTREKLLNKKDLTLTKAIQLLKSSEATQLQAQDMAPQATSTVQVIATRAQRQQSERRQSQRTGSSSRSQRPCRYCGRKHDFRKAACPAVDKQCYICNKKGHFAKQCQSAKAHHIEDSCSEEEEVFFIHVVKSPASQPALVTCTINERHKVTFEIDTGASCNVLPLADYIKATGDKWGALLNPTKTRLMMHNNTSATPVGKVMLHVERSGNTHLLCFL